MVRKRERGRRDLRRYWAKRYNAFIRAGFTPEEATAGANEGLKLSDLRVQSIMEHREAHVEHYMDQGLRREEAILRCGEDLELKLEQLDIEGINLFYEVS